ncbi:MAG: hypothetical protein RLZZ347_400 [Candidatus Parcubacteria bacterium]|jgi:TatD DNase family protein
MNLASIKYIDIHSHPHFESFNTDQKEMLVRMREAGVATIAVGTDLATSKHAVALAESEDGVWATVGLHPDDKHDEVFDVEAFEKLLTHPKVVAIGECGLDYARLPSYDDCSPIGIGRLPTDVGEQEREKSRQRQIFLAQIALAQKYDKPLMLHCREHLKNSFGAGQAYHDMLAILREASKVKALRGNAHFFAGTLEIARALLDLGFTLSFTGVITFARQYDEVIRAIPLDRIHAETDAPFVSPVPYRGKRNEPAYVVEVVKKLAEIRGESLEVFQKALIQNARKLFRV